MINKVKKRNDGFIELLSSSDFYEMCYSMKSSENYEFVNDSFYTLFKENEDLSEKDMEIMSNMYLSIWNENYSSFRVSILNGKSFEIEPENLTFFETTPFKVDTPEDILEDYEDSIGYSPPETLNKVILPDPQVLEDKIMNQDLSKIDKPDIDFNKVELTGDEFRFRFCSHVNDKEAGIAKKLQKRIEKRKRRMIKTKEGTANNFQEEFWSSNKYESEEYRCMELKDLWKEMFKLNYDSYLNSMVIKKSNLPHYASLKINNFVLLDMIGFEEETQCEYCGAIDFKENILNLEHSYYNDKVNICPDCIKWNRKDFIQDNIPKEIIKEAKNIEKKWK